jgi:hypothetical protein
MKRMFLFLSLLSIFCVAACDVKKEVTIIPPTNLNPQAKDIISKAWPKIMTACPGFQKYGNEITMTNIDNNLDATYFPGVEIAFQVISPTKDIPFEYRAFGHTCSYLINPSGTSLRIQKGCCVSICLDKQYETNGKDFNLSLNN